MREYKKAKQEAGELASPQTLSKMGQELQEIRDMVSRLKT